MNDSIYRVYKEDFDLSVDAEKCAMEIIDYLLQNELWADVTVYANGKAWSCVSRTGKYHYENSWKTSVFCQDGINPQSFFNYNGDFLSMSFEGDLNHIFNYYETMSYCNRIIAGFNAIIERYGRHYELGNAWNLSLYR